MVNERYISVELKLKCMMGANKIIHYFLNGEVIFNIKKKQDSF